MIKLNLTGALRVSCDLLQNCMQNSFEPCAHIFNCSFQFQTLILFAIAQFSFNRPFWTCIIFVTTFDSITFPTAHFISIAHLSHTFNQNQLRIPFHWNNKKKTRRMPRIFDCQNKKSIEWIIIDPENWRNVWKICERQLSC